MESKSILNLYNRSIWDLTVWKEMGVLSKYILPSKSPEKPPTEAFSH